MEYIYTEEFYSAIRKNEMVKIVGKLVELEKLNKGNTGLDSQILHALYHM